MNTDLELYKVFCEVVKYKNISRTAEKMYISQSAITQSIQKLETLLGGKVFYRNKNGVELTEEGKNLYEYIKDSIETMSNAENIFSKYVNLEKGKLRIGSGNSLFSSLLFEPFLNFINKYPNIEATIGSGITDNLMQKLSNGELDLVALNLPFRSQKFSNIEIIPLKKSVYCFYASKQYVKEHNINTIKDIENSPLILPTETSSKKKILNEYCNKEKIELKANYEFSSSEIMKRMVLNNVGIGFTNIENIENVKYLIKVIAKIEPTDAKEGIATLKKTMCNKATLELVKEIKEYYKKN